VYDHSRGVHEQVAEFDFESLYPNIMRKYNLSAETIRRNCCNDIKINNNDNDDTITYAKPGVPDLDYHICQRRTGIVPTSLKILLNKRAKYKS
jgi:DNA polymerase elongation subunit (family B)